MNQQQQQSVNQSETNVNKIKSNDEENSPAECAVAAVNGEQQLADIFKLNIDCFEEVFDYLSLKDLAAMGQTCKRMQRIAGHCFQLNYGAAEADFNKGGFDLNGVKIDCFNKFLQNVYFMYGGKEDENARYNRMINFITQLKHSTSFKKIDISDFRSKMPRINEIKEVLSKAESVRIHGYDENENELDALTACSNLKYLSLRKGHRWMHRIYPSLEHIELSYGFRAKIPEIKIFFDLNTTIKQFSVDMTLFWSIRELFKNSNIKFDILAINYDDGDGIVEFQLFCRLLNELYDSGFYKKLHFNSPYWMHQEVIDELASVKGILLNLKRVHSDYASSDDILPFIRHAEKVNKIRVEELLSGSHFDENDNVLDLFALNKEREKLVGARKITIYVPEDVYLLTKWAMKQTDFKLIEMKRITSYDWDF
ncbi:uncharacterized protein LOC116348520 [Contarinia nasturtii]|uniref:uncharacterized protein LOC116348520 n=1 Tax=Contarinia nasturtii TaxID=265458 RepID=UPI0012D382C7|nr:uncharacterized protein LOC116348520 [Contarinia nasturtii]